MARVLVIDDSKFSRNLAARALREAGHEVVEACNGELGLEAVRDHTPDCVVLDLLMPVLDGPGFLQRLRGDGSDLPVVVATADIQKSSREQCEELGVSGFVNKPARAEELCPSVDAGPPGRVEAGGPMILSPDQEDAMRRADQHRHRPGRRHAQRPDGDPDRAVDPQRRAVRGRAAGGREEADGPSMAIAQTFDGPCSGRAALVLPRDSGLRMAQILGGVEDGSDELDLELSGILVEVGNIMINGVLGSLANATGSHLLYGIPEFYGDPESAFLATPRQGGGVQGLLVANAHFLVKRFSVRGSLLISFERGGISAVLQALCESGSGGHGGPHERPLGPVRRTSGVGRAAST